jgi:putative transposase
VPTPRPRCADWTLQQLREVIGFDDTHRYLIHDRDRIFARRLNESIEALGVNVLKSPLHSPKANALSESHLRSILTSWVEHYNRGRPHSSLGPGVPDPPGILAMVQKVKSRHRLGEGVAVLAKSVLGGLHHEYSTAPSIG